MSAYLASPYIHKDSAIVESRAEAAIKAAAALMDAGEVVFSPIAHGHTLQKYMRSQSAGDHRFWLNQCYRQLIHAEKLYILGLAGWRESTGVRWEVETSYAFRIPVFLLNAEDLSDRLEITKGDWQYKVR